MFLYHSLSQTNINQAHDWFWNGLVYLDDPQSIQNSSISFIGLAYCVCVLQCVLIYLQIPSCHVYRLFSYTFWILWKNFVETDSLFSQHGPLESGLVFQQKLTVKILMYFCDQKKGGEKLWLVSMIYIYLVYLISFGKIIITALVFSCRIQSMVIFIYQSFQK